MPQPKGNNGLVPRTLRDEARMDILDAEGDVQAASRAAEELIMALARIRRHHRSAVAQLHEAQTMEDERGRAAQLSASGEVAAALGMAA